MSWLDPIDGYCERIGPESWAGPVNAVTNAAFLIAAAVMAGRLRGEGLALVVVLAVIGLGSFLFHTHANRLTALMDVLPILAFILLYVFAATRDFLGARSRVAAAAALGFLPCPVLSLRCRCSREYRGWARLPSTRRCRC